MMFSLDTVSVYFRDHGSIIPARVNKDGITKQYAMFVLKWKRPYSRSYRNLLRHYNIQVVLIRYCN